ncbi:E3 ubiquitin-protein ligase rnf8-like isoform x1, partial [Globisporangium splendens]
MGQTTSVQEDKMKKRIRQNMGSFLEFGHHLKQANEWARLCPTPKSCHLAFRVVVNERISAEILPYVWRIRGNVSVEVRKIRRRTETSPMPLDLDAMSTVMWRNHTMNLGREASEAIGHAKVLTVRQFYYIYCFLSESALGAGDSDFDETECQICMDKQKQVVLPCTHSFCLGCFQHWSAQNSTCPICRSKIECSEGSELWQLTSNEVEDIGSYATDLVARIFEFLEKKDRSTYTEEAMKRSAELYASAVAVTPKPFNKFVHAELFPTRFSPTLPLGLSSLLTMPGVNLPSEFDEDVLLALELASGEDQHAAVKHYEQLRRDHVYAMTLAMQAEEEEDDPEEL